MESLLIFIILVVFALSMFILAGFYLIVLPIINEVYGNVQGREKPSESKLAD